MNASILSFWITTQNRILPHLKKENNILKFPEWNEFPTKLLIKFLMFRPICRIIGHKWNEIDYKNYRITCSRCHWKQYSAYPEPWSLIKKL